MLAISSLFGFSVLLGAAIHTERGTEYGEKAVDAYAKTRHGPDGSLFLDPYFKSVIENLNDKKVLDAGCGAAPWAIYAAKQGGEVYAIDIQEGMVQAAKMAIAAAEMTDKISLSQGDVAALSYEEAFFDIFLSICVGCNLPEGSFEKHFSELERTLKCGGVGVVAAPCSLNVVFTDNSKSEREFALDIEEVLGQLPQHPSSDLISEKLTQLEGVLSATFYLENGYLTLVSNEKDLKEGQKIWRKLSKLVVPNCYHSQEAYLSMFKKYGFHIRTTDLPHFLNEEAREYHNHNVNASLQLGPAYVLHPPFVIFHLSKT